jgi:peptide/nickel transport system substrate-binding protein
VNSPRTISRRRFLQAAGGGISVLYLANGGKVVAQTPSPTAMNYAEAPTLADLVAAGSLPPVNERLPQNPLVVEPTESIGKYGGTWRTALVGGADTTWLSRTVGYEHLLRFAPQWDEIVPGVASGYEINADGTEYTFTLRPGMRWSDGEPFTSADIEFFANDVYLHPELGTSTTFGTFTVEVIDEFAFKVVYAEPNGLFITNLAAGEGEPWTHYPKHYLSQFHETYNTTDLDALVAANGATDWVNLFQIKGSSIPGTPYNASWQNPELPRVHAWNIVAPYGDSERVTFERNPYYFKVDPEGNQLPYIDAVNFDVVQDNEVLLLKAAAGELDMHSRHINVMLNKPVLADAQESGEFHFFDLLQAIMNTSCYMLNLTHKDPVKREIFQNKDFRIGLSHAINRQEIIDVIYVSQGEPWQCAPRRETPYFNETLAKQFTEYDVDLANEFLDKVVPEKDGEGWRLRPDGQRLSFVIEVTGSPYADLIDSTNLIVGYWRAVGIDVQMTSEDRSLFNSRTEANDHDVAVWPGGSGLLDALTRGYMYYPQNSSSRFAVAWAYWLSNVPSPAAEPVEPPQVVKDQYAIFGQIAQTPDEAEQYRLMGELLTIAQEQFYAIGVSLPGNGYGIAKNTFKNVPASMPDATQYPTPAPTNPEQYFFDV